MTIYIVTDFNPNVVFLNYFVTFFNCFVTLVPRQFTTIDITNKLGGIGMMLFKKRQFTRYGVPRKRGRKFVKFFVCLGLILGLLLLSNSIVGQAISLLNFDQKIDLPQDEVNIDDTTDTTDFEGDANLQEEGLDETEENDKVNNDEHKDETDKKEDEKIVYLTFDDGPTKKITLQVLEILERYDVKGTFFVLGNLAEKNPDIIKTLDSKGHLVANHTYSHNYKYLYSNTSNLLGELKKTHQIIEDILEKEMPKIMRFPGGSSGKKLAPFRKEVVINGYTYFDWNVVNGDAEGKNLTKSYLIERVKETNQNYKKAIVLMHDSNTKQVTVDALPEIIEYFLEEGYTFDTLDNYN